MAVKVEVQPRTFKVTLELSEQEAEALYTVVACVAKFGVAYRLCEALEQAGVEWDTGLLEKSNAELVFKARV